MPRSSFSCVCVVAVLALLTKGYCSLCLYGSTSPVSDNALADYILQLSGRAADPATLSQLVYIAANHDSRITHVDTVRAYHLGTNLLVEVRHEWGKCFDTAEILLRLPLAA